MDLLRSVEGAKNKLETLETAKNLIDNYPQIWIDAALPALGVQAG